MNKTYLIFKHEFLHLLKRKAFVIMTLIVPLIALLVIEILNVASTRNQTSVTIKTIGYVDEAGGFERFTDQGSIRLIRFDTRGDAAKAIAGGSIEEYFVIPRDYIPKGVIERYTLKKELSQPADSSGAISGFLVNNLLADKVPAATADRIQNPLTLVSVLVDNNGAPAPDQGVLGNFVIMAIFSILFALSMIFSSSYLLQGLVREKENRLMEILLSSVSTRQLLTGKILGLGAAGIVQVAVWLASLPLIMSLASSGSGIDMSMVRLPAGSLALGVIYFILGYLLFAVLSAGVGAISTSQQEGQQLASIYTLFALWPLWFMSLIIMHPDSPVWDVFSIFPFSSPVLVMVRMGVTSIPPWEIAASIAALILTIIGGLLFSARVFRAYLLMYGKRPKLREVFRNLKNA